MHPVYLILSSVVLGVAGQLMLKSGVSAAGLLSIRRGGLLALIWRVASRPMIWAGLATYGISTLFWLAALSQVELGIRLSLYQSQLRAHPRGLLGTVQGRGIPAQGDRHSRHLRRRVLGGGRLTVRAGAFYAAALLLAFTAISSWSGIFCRRIRSQRRSIRRMPRLRAARWHG